MTSGEQNVEEYVWLLRVPPTSRLLETQRQYKLNENSLIRIGTLGK